MAAEPPFIEAYCTAHAQSAAVSPAEHEQLFALGVKRVPFQPLLMKIGEKPAFFRYMGFLAFFSPVFKNPISG
jgi:hypothetical protein